MIKFGFIAASLCALVLLVLATPAPLLAQSAISSGQSPFNSGRDQSTRAATPPAPTTGVFCTQEMTATFCNVVTGPNTNGYGRNTGGSTGAAGTAGAGAGNTSSIPPCPAHPPFNELCD